MADYKIKDLENLSGIKSHTIRIWEKRYELLSPNRTQTKIRTYTDSDLVKLLNISILNENGWKISKIASLSETDLTNQVSKVALDAASNSAVVNLFIKSLTTLDGALFSRVFDNCINKESLTATYENYLIPFLKRIGVMWLVGSINAAQEHFISSLIRQKVIVAIDRLKETEKTVPDFILFCREGEWHELGLLYYCFRLKEKGYSVLYLGQNLPVDAVQEVVSSMQFIPKVVSSFVSPVDEDMLAYLKNIQEKVNTKLYVGGAQTDNLKLKQEKNIFDVKKLFSE